MNQFVTAYDKSSAFMDAPLICVSDPATSHRWEWAVGLDHQPTLTSQEMQTLLESAPDLFEMVSDDLNMLSGGIKNLLGSDHPGKYSSIDSDYSITVKS